MADMYGRLTQRAGVCLGTLGPGATNLVTGVADAWLDRSPLVALTGQGDLERMHKESHQYIDVVSMFKPDHEVERAAELAADDPRGRSARRSRSPRSRSRARPTSSCPRTSWRRTVDAEPLARRARARAAPEPGAGELLRAAELIRDAINPLVLAGNGVARGDAAPALREFARATGIGVAETFMGKGAARLQATRTALGTVGLQSRDYALAGFEDADVVITVGYDLVEHAPDELEPAGRQDDRLHRHGRRRRSTSTSSPTVDLIGDIYHILRRLAEELRDVPRTTTAVAARRHRARRASRPAKDDDAFPMQPPRVLWEIRQALGRARHPHLRRRPAQAVDRAHVPGATSPTRC